jgi:AcrR family transcriptional regulator
VKVIAQDGVRGLRIEKLAAEASISSGLIYYYFKDRDGVLGAALEYINHRAQNYTEPGRMPGDPRGRIESMLLLELQDSGEVRTTSIAWGELRASAVFNNKLRDSLRATTVEWNDDIESLIRELPIRPGMDPADAACRLTALVEGLSERWHSGSITLERARELVSGAVRIELDVLTLDAED